MGYVRPYPNGWKRGCNTIIGGWVRLRLFICRIVITHFRFMMMIIPSVIITTRPVDSTPTYSRGLKFRENFQSTKEQIPSLGVTDLVNMAVRVNQRSLVKFKGSRSMTASVRKENKMAEGCKKCIPRFSTSNHRLESLKPGSPPPPCCTEKIICRNMQLDTSRGKYPDGDPTNRKHLSGNKVSVFS